MIGHSLGRRSPNKSPYADTAITQRLLTPAVMASIKNATQHDQALYDFARALTKTKPKTKFGAVVAGPVISHS